MLQASVDSPESPVSGSLLEIQQALSLSVDGVTKALGLFSPNTQIALAVVAIIFAVFITAILWLSLRRGSTADGHGLGEIFERIDRLEIAYRQSAHATGMSPEVKGAIGYFKQELRELRQICLALHDRRETSHESGITSQAAHQETHSELSESPNHNSAHQLTSTRQPSGDKNRRPTGGLIPERSLVSPQPNAPATARARAGEIPTRLVAEARAALSPETRANAAFYQAPRSRG